MKPLSLILEAATDQPSKNAGQFPLQFLLKFGISRTVEFTLGLVNESVGKVEQFEAFPESRIMRWGTGQEVGQQEQGMRRPKFGVFFIPKIAAR